MNEELGREFTSAESLAIATGQTTIMDIVHGYALELDAARRQEVAVVMPSGTILTHGEIEDEVRRTRLASRALRPIPAHSWIIGVNASSNMFA
jgi:hypothetical protein